MDTYRAIGPLLRLFPAETAHGLALGALRLGLVPPALTRLLLLKVVGSRPARRASPEGERPFWRARASMACQMSAGLNMASSPYNHIPVMALGIKPQERRLGLSSFGFGAAPATARRTPDPPVVIPGTCASTCFRLEAHHGRRIML